MADQDPRPRPVKVVVVSLLLWATLAGVLSFVYVLDGRPAAWAGVGIAVASYGLAWWAWRRRLWVQPLFAAHYALAFGCIVAGPIANLDVYVVGGILALTVLSVGWALLVRLEELVRQR